MKNSFNWVLPSTNVNILTKLCKMDIAAQYAVVPLLKPYLSAGVKVDYTDGINFASSTACVLNENCPYAVILFFLFICPPIIVILTY